MVVTRVIAAPASVVWRTFIDLPTRRCWLSEVDDVYVIGTTGPDVRWRETRRGRNGRPNTVVEELRLTIVEPGRQCSVSLAVEGPTHRLSYVFTPIDLGPHRGGTTVTVATIGGRPQGLTDRLLAFVVGGFAARCVEGVVRDELAALAGACQTRSYAAA